MSGDSQNTPPRGLAPASPAALRTTRKGRYSSLRGPKRGPPVSVPRTWSRNQPWSAGVLRGGRWGSCPGRVGVILTFGGGWSCGTSPVPESGHRGGGSQVRF